MDSVSQKQNFLSLTGIDQLSENTDNIELLQAQVKALNDKVDTDVIPNYVSTQNIDQQIEGTKSFVSAITTTGLNTFFNSATGKPLDIVFESKEIPDKQYKLIYNPLLGVKINGPLTLDDSVLKMANIQNLETSLLDLKNQSVTTGLVSTIQANVKSDFAAGSVVSPFVTATVFQSGTVTATTSLTVSNATKNANLYADIATISSVKVNGALDCQAINVGSIPYLNVAIPFQPSLQRAMTGIAFTTAQPISFYAGANYSFAGAYTGTIASTNIMTRYLHPFNYTIMSITAMFDSPTTVPTANVTHAISLQLYSADGATIDNTAPVRVTFTVTPTMRCAKATLNLRVPFNKSLGGTHSFTPFTATTSLKGCYYILHGYQNM